MSKRSQRKHFIEQVWGRITSISQMRSTNSPPKKDVKKDFEYLSDLLAQIERVTKTKDAQLRLYGAYTEKEIRYLRHGLSQLELYNQPAGADLVKEEDVRIYIFYVQSKFIEMVEKLIDLLI